jgi:phage tail sheath gpL-like
MTINFNQIPSNFRPSAVLAEIDNSRAQRGLAQFNTRILVIGQRLSTGTVAAETLTLTPSGELAKKYFGQGSMLANMIKALKENNRQIDCYALALADDSEGTAATGAIVFTGSSPTENGTLSLYVAGKRLQVAITTAMTAANIATAVAAAINANADLPVTASPSTATVTVTARHKGTVGNQIDLRVNYQGLAGGEKTPAGVAVAITAMASGAGDPDVQDAIDALPDEVFDFIVSPYSDTTNLGKLETELASRWNALRALNGHVFIAKNLTLGNQTTFGTARNSQNVTCFSYYDSPVPPYEVAAMGCGRVALSASQDPARPFHDLELVGMLPPPEISRWTLEERNTLLFSGLTPLKVTRAGKVLTDRVITMYQTNNVDTTDPSYLDLTTMTTLSFLRQDWIAFQARLLANLKIVDDGTRTTPQQNAITPSGIKALAVGKAQEWVAAGLIENLPQFIQDLVVERNESDRTRVDILMSPDLVNGLNQIATNSQFRL